VVIVVFSAAAALSSQPKSLAMLEDENERLRAEIEEQRREKDEAVGEKVCFSF